MAKMQRLNPLKVPWQVSPSTPFLRLFASESASDKASYVVFVANFGSKAEQGATEIGYSSTTLASNPYALGTQPGEASLTHNIVKIEFDRGVWARFSPGYSDREVLNPDEFDFSLIPFSDLSTDVAAWLEAFRQSWTKSGLCPDPGIYTVESSDWIKRLAVTGFEHFLIQGHDAYVEIVARNWSWHAIQALPENW